MRQRRPEGVPSCTLEEALEIIGGRWTLSILWWLQRGPTRFGELKRLIPGVTQKMLTQQLRQLEVDGLVTRTVYATVPPKVEYDLTPLGKDLKPALQLLCTWSEENLPQIRQARNKEGTTADETLVPHPSSAQEWQEASS